MVARQTARHRRSDCGADGAAGLTLPGPGPSLPLVHHERLIWRAYPLGPIMLQDRAPQSSRSHSGIWGLLAPLMLFSLFANLLLLTGPLFMLQVYDRVLSSHSTQTLVVLLALVAVLFALYAAIDFARGALLARLAAALQVKAAPAAFDSAARGDGAALAQLDRLAALIASPLSSALFDLPWTVLFIAALFLLHPTMGWLALSGFLVLVLMAGLTRLLVRHLARHVADSTSTASRLALQANLAGDTVTGLGMGAEIGARWADLRLAALMQAVRLSDRSGAVASLARAFRLFLQSAVLALGAWLVLQGQISGGAMVAASILLGRALGPVEMILSNWPTIQAGLDDWRAQANLPAPHPSRARVATRSGALVVERLSWVPRPGRAAVLAAISFRLNPGRALAIVGASGAGKTALARLITGVNRPTAGHLYGPVTSVGYLPQDVEILPGTVATNIARMACEPDAGAVERAARLAGVHDAILAMPMGYQTPVGHGGHPISGGVRQRLGLARALIGDPHLVVLDEPGTHLDAEGIAALARMIENCKARGAMVIALTNRTDQLSGFDDMVILDRGRIVRQGPRGDLVAELAGKVRRLHQSVPPVRA